MDKGRSSVTLREAESPVPNRRTARRYERLIRASYLGFANAGTCREILARSVRKRKDVLHCFPTSGIWIIRPGYSL